jgi:hypothetical protein
MTAESHIHDGRSTLSEPPRTRRAALRALALGGAASTVGLALATEPAAASVVDYSQPGTFTAPQTFAPSTDAVAITVRGSSGQTQNLQEWRNPQGSVLMSIAPDGKIVLGGDTAFYRYAQNHVALEANTLIKGSVTLDRSTSPAVTPELRFKAQNGSWLMGIDSSNGGRDMVLAARVDGDAVGDLIYVAHGGTGNPTVGIGVTPPSSAYRLQISPPDDEPDMGGLAVRLPPNGRGAPLSVLDSSGRPRLSFDSEVWATGLRARGDAETNTMLTMATSDLRSTFAFTSGGTDLRLRYLQGAQNVFSVGTDARMLFYKAANFAHSGAQFPHVGASTPSGGLSGEVRVGSGRLWINDAGTWRSLPLAAV